jgi:hypothetical protein
MMDIFSLFNNFATLKLFKMLTFDDSKIILLFLYTGFAMGFSL